MTTITIKINTKEKPHFTMHSETKAGNRLERSFVRMLFGLIHMASNAFALSMGIEPKNEMTIIEREHKPEGGR